MLRIDINILFTVINLIILVVAMRIFLFKPIHKILDERQKIVEQSLSDAAAAKESAAALEQQHKDSLATVYDERENILLEARSSAALETDKLLLDARAKAEKLIRDAQERAELQKKDMLEKTQAEISEIVVSAASKLIMQPQSGDNGELYDIFLGKTRDDHD